MGRTSRWIVFLPVAALALWGQPASADATHNLWTCWASSTDQWTMLQPMEHYRAGYYPTWSDCLNWRYGPPAEPYTWSYGLPNVATTTTEQTTTTVETTTTLETTTTWESSTTSTIPETTSTDVPATTVPAETSTSLTTSTTTTTVAPTTTTTTTTSTTTTTVAPPPTQPWVPPATTSSTTTSTTSTTTTIVQPSTTVVPTTLPPETTTIVPVTTSLQQSSTTTTTSTTIPVETTIVASTTSVPVLPAILQVDNLTGLAAEQVFAELDVSDLDEEQIDSIIAAVQDAPTEVREAFESSINVFGEGFDDYIPLGSTVPVETRRTLIAVAAGTGLAAVGASRRNK